VLTNIISGLQAQEYLFSKSNSVAVALLKNVLLPLHSPNDMIDWRDQIPLIQVKSLRKENELHR